MTLQYPSQSMSQMINGVVRVFPVIPDDNETTERGASNVTKGSHIIIQRTVGASSNISDSIHSSLQVIC